MISFGLLCLTIVYCIIMIILYPTFIPSYISLIVILVVLFLYLKKEKEYYHLKLINIGLGYVTGYSLYMALYIPKLKLIHYVILIVLIIASFFSFKELLEKSRNNPS